MRWFALFFISSAVISQVLASPTQIKPKIVANVNEFVDQLLKNLREFLVVHNLDPFKVANITEEFYFNFLFQNHTGHINLANGWLQDISTIRRGAGDATAKYDHQLLTITFDIIFDDLLFNSLYDAKILTFSPDGKFTAQILKPEGKVSILVDLERITFSLQQFELIVNGKVDIDLTGISIIGPVVNVVVDAITGLFKNTIVSSISDQIREAIENFLDKLPPLLPPATTTTVTTTPSTTVSTTTKAPPTTAPPATDPPVTDPPATDPPATEPPATDPPATEPPATDPPATEPPATEPPATDPPATDPPATDPPATDPPATDPPATDPPATDPPATDPPATDPPATDAPAGLNHRRHSRQRLTHQRLSRQRLALNLLKTMNRLL